MKNNPFDIIPETVIGNHKWSAPVYDERDGAKHERIQLKTWEQVTGGSMNYSNHRTVSSSGKCWQGKSWDEIQDEILRLMDDVKREQKKGIGQWFTVQAVRVGNYGIQLVLID
jgi:hypothetical protein